MNTAQLVPVSEWVYDLYKVTYFDRDPEQGGRVIKTIHIASSCENHLESDASEYAPRDECVYIWEVVKENVGKPHVVGQMYGVDVYETGLSHGTRLAAM